MENKRDNWDRLEIFIKLFNGVVITVLTIVIGYSAQQVADSIKYGELTQKLLTDLSLRDTHSKVKRDLSLITLNRTIGDDKHRMLADMAEVICESDSSTIKEKTIAFTILKERDSCRATSLVNKYTKNLLASLADTSVRKSSISLAEAAPSDVNPLPKINTSAEQSAQAQIGSAIITVFIQTNRNIAGLSKIQSILSKQGFLVPQVEVINRPFQNSVRHFNSEDAATASLIAEKIVRENVRWRLKVLQLKNPGSKVPPGQIEVWIRQ